MAIAPCLSLASPVVAPASAPSRATSQRMCGWSRFRLHCGTPFRCALSASLLLPRNPSIRTSALPAVKVGDGRFARGDCRRGCDPRRGRVSASLAGPGSVQVAASMFQLATAFVVPFYTVMILAPRWEWTRRLMESELPYFVLGAAYFYLLCRSWTPETLRLMFSSKYWLPELSGITRMFTSTLTVASAWLHLLAADLFAGRQVFLDGVAHGVETRHSLVLCLMMCPIGILSHLLTKSIVLLLRRARSEADAEEVRVDFRPF